MGRKIEKTHDVVMVNVGQWFAAAAALSPSRVGELPALAVLVLRNPVRPPHYGFRTAIARATEDGVWEAGDSVWEGTYGEAMAVFMDRLSHRI